MKIKEVHLRQFKRFTDLHVTELPEAAKLVVLVGSNGSGKTSLFEAFNFWQSPVRGVQFDVNYHWKVPNPDLELGNWIVSTNWGELYNKVKINLFGHEGFNPQNDPQKGKKAFYFRSAYRNEPQFATSSIGRIGDALEDQRRPQTLISTETRVSDNYQRLVSASIEALYDPSNDSRTILDIRERLIGRIREAMLRVFEDLVLSSPGHPMMNGTFLFQKGTSRDFQYQNLSGGEKATFDLLLDFIVKTEFFDDTVFCIDEPELHMHTKLQAKLLEELFRQLPDDCQLWIATHSIGMTKRAMEMHQLNPDEVIFLDFDGKDFDNEVTVTPARVDRVFWKRVFRFALDDLAELVAPAKVIFCEGKPDHLGKRSDKTFDAEIYRLIFRESHPDAEFIPLGGTTEIEKNALLLEGNFRRLFSSMRMWTIRDRDDLSDEEIEGYNKKETRVLQRRDIENYLWDDEILKKLCEDVEKPDKLPEILNIKQQLIADLGAKQKPSDDIKAISGMLYNDVKRILELRQHGNTAEAFAKDMLAPLITPETLVYNELNTIIFGE